MYLFSDKDSFNPKQLEKLFIRYSINVCFFTAALFNEIVDDNVNVLKSLSVLLTGGEQASPRHIRKTKDELPLLKLYNVYGPTENSTFSTIYTIPSNSNERIPIGKPIGGTEVLILQSTGKLAPVGIGGEICLAGIGLARGYLNQVDLTESCFTDHPFVKGKPNL